MFKNLYHLTLMSVDGDLEGGEAGATGSTEGQAQEPAVSSKETPGDTATAESVEDLPQWAQKLVGDLRKEAAGNRTKGKEAAQKATQQAQADIAQQIGKALGITSDDGDKQTASVDELTAQVAEAQQAKRQSQIDLAIFKSASEHSVNAGALLDSRAFQESVKDLEPDSDGFEDNLGAAIKAAVEKNPHLGQVPSKSGGEIGGGKQASTFDPEKAAASIRNKRNY